MLRLILLPSILHKRKVCSADCSPEAKLRVLGLFQSEDSLLHLFIFLVEFHSRTRLASELVNYAGLPSGEVLHTFFLAMH